MDAFQLICLLTVPSHAREKGRKKDLLPVVTIVSALELNWLCSFWMKLRITASLECVCEECLCVCVMYACRCMYTYLHVQACHSMGVRGRDNLRWLSSIFTVFVVVSSFAPVCARLDCKFLGILSFLAPIFPKNTVMTDVSLPYLVFLWHLRIWTRP